MDEKFWDDLAKSLSYPISKEEIEKNRKLNEMLCNLHTYIPDELLNDDYEEIDFDDE